MEVLERRSLLGLFGIPEKRGDLLHGSLLLGRGATPLPVGFKATEAYPSAKVVPTP